jgi:hypothetical protein
MGSEKPSENPNISGRKNGALRPGMCMDGTGHQISFVWINLLEPVLVTTLMCMSSVTRTRPDKENISTL